MVVGLAVSVTTCHSVSSIVSIGALAATAAATAVAHGGSEIVAVTIIVGMILVVVVMIPVDGHRAVRAVRARAVRIPSIVVGIVPAPSVVETVAVPVGGIVVGTVVIARPPPVITHVNA